MRPRVDRPVIRGLSDREGPLRLEFPDGRVFDLGSDDFLAAVAESRVVAVEFELGTFLIISERRARGGWYWIARAYHKSRRASFYMGREFGEREVREAAEGLVARLAGTHSPPSGPPIDDVVRDLLEREHEPGRRAAAEAIAAMVRRVPARGGRPS